MLRLTVTSRNSAFLGDFKGNGEMKQVNVPELRFNILSGKDACAWRKIKLEDLVSRVTRKNEKLESTLPLTISAQYGLIDQNKFFTKRIASKDVSGYYLIKKGEFAYNKSTSNDAPWGAIKRLDQYNCGVLSTLYIIFKIKNDYSNYSNFLASYYETDKWHRGIQEIASEGARNHGLLNIAPTDFFKTNIWLPKEKDELQKIGDFFSALDRRISLADRKLAALQNIKKGMLQKIFSQELRFKDDEGKEFPAWERKKIGDICKIIRGISYSKKNVTDIKNSTIVLRSNNISDAYILDYSNNLQFINIFPEKEQILKMGDIVICLANGSINLVGKTAVYDGKSKNSIITVGAFCAIIRTNFQIIRYFFETNLYRKALKHLKQGGNGAIGNLSPKDIENISLLIPSIKEQSKIASYFSYFDKQIFLADKKLKTLLNIKNGFLQKMFI